MNRGFYLFSLFLFVLLISTAKVFSQTNIYEPPALEEISFELSDMGTMWTFDDIPLEYFEKKYGFRPSDEWIQDVQMSALQFGGGCSAAFVSEDGLIMTNHHCGRGQLQGLQNEGENLLRDGFYAENLEEEREVPNLFVDQLRLIVDVTDEIAGAFVGELTDSEKVERRNQKINELVDQYSESSGLICRVVTLYNGGKYSLYGYKRYSDIRLVMVPDFQIASTGWDWDNFTYPRYELDFAFYRAYDDEGKPVKSEHYFNWSSKGADEGEPVFVVGRPGSTNRLYSVEQIKYLRDKTYPNALLLFNELYKVYFELFEKYPERESELLNRVMSWGNARKSYAGRLLGLNNPYVLKKKEAFEKEIKSIVTADPVLNSKYGHVWDSISVAVSGLRKIIDKLAAYQLRGYIKPVYFDIAVDVIKYAEQISLPEEDREDDYKTVNISQTKLDIFSEEIDVEFENKLLRAQINYVSKMLGYDDDLVKKLYNNKKDEDAVNLILDKSSLTDKSKFDELMNKDSEQILNSDDPFIYYILKSRNELDELRTKEIDYTNSLQVYNQELGALVYSVYGNKIPPDATSTLRISDGEIEGYEYNGTLAPSKTTYFGLWDRYFSFNQKSYPWGLHERWQNIPEDFDLSVPMCFVSTTDIVGGNSGSSIINKNAEVVGLAHDGNLESLAGHIIFLPENNRTVATDSYGLIHALKYVFKTTGLVKELESGRLN